jgi:DNA polymerase
VRGVTLAHEVDWDGFRQAARALALEGVAPRDVAWSVERPADLFADAPDDPVPTPPAPNGAFTLPRAVVALAQTAIQAREPERFALLYDLVWRVHRGERRILEMTTDALVHRLTKLEQAVRRDTHKMRAFLRFREVMQDGAARYVGWFEPDHYIVEANAGFFMRRFATLVWSILTPYRSLHWNGAELVFAPGARRAELPDDDRMEAYWRSYYASIFNPARLKVAAMTAEMPKKYWRNLPEAAAIPELIREAQPRTDRMVEAPHLTTPRPLPRPTRPATAPAGDSRLAAAAREAAECQRCPLWKPATQTVFGEGPADARIMFVGEQPGDQEDLAGRPFVGPAGQLFDRAMAEAGLDRTAVYVTNAVKHFMFEPRGKRRIHAKPETMEIEACKPWLEIERAEVRPHLLVAMGATAARAVMGRTVTITRERGRPMPWGDGQLLITVHPSYLLRLPDEAAKAREYAAFVGDLRQAAALVAGG